jgi:hypothetical protein
MVTVLARHENRYTMMNTPNRDALELLDHWRQRVRTLQKLHYDRAEVFARKNMWLGLPAAVLSGSAGASVLVSVVEPFGAGGTIAVGFVSIVAATLSILQTTLKLDEQAQQHRSAGIGYGVLNRSLEHALAVPPSSEEGVQIMVDRFEQQLNQLAQHVPAIPRKLFANLPPGYVPERGKVDLAGQTNSEFRVFERNLNPNSLSAKTP